jgi:hypothetical protein
MFPLGRFKFSQKFLEILANKCLSPDTTTLAISCSLVSATPGIKISPLLFTLPINPCHRFSVITRVFDTGDKFVTGVNNTGEQLWTVTTTPVMNSWLVKMTSVNNYHL